MADAKISALPASTTPLAGTEVLPVVQSSTTKQVSVANLTAGRAVSMASGTVTGDLTVDTSTLKVDSTNNRVGVGTASPGRLLELYTAGSPVLRWNDSSSTWDIRTNGSVGSAMQFDYNGTRFFTLLSGGDFQNNTGNYIPLTAGKGINFTANTPAAGMTSQLLNWYEEGTWTPQDSGGNAIGSGTYTRIGRLVTLNIVINANSVSTAYIQNIPFAKSGDYFGGYFTRALRGNTISNGFSCRVMVGFTSTTTIDFLTNVSSGADAAFTLTTEASGTVRVGLVVTYTV